MRWLKWLGVAVAVLVLLLAIALWWLLGTGSGLRFALGQVSNATDGALTVQRASGDLAGPLTVESLRYQNAEGTELRVAHATLDVAIWPLLGGTARIEQLHATGVVVVLGESVAREPETQSTFSLEPPMDIELRDIAVSDIDVRRDDESLFVADQIVLAGAWTHEGLRVDTLAVQGPDGHVDAHGQLQIGSVYRGEGHADFAWQLGDLVLAGTLETRSDGDTAHAILTLTQPLQVNLTLAVQQRDDYPWQLDLVVPRGDASALPGADSIDTLAVNLHATGTQDGARLEGRVEVNDWPLEIAPLTLALNDDRSTLEIKALTVTSPRVPGTLHAEGQVALDAEPIAARLTLGWEGVELPPELAGQALATDGKLAFQGSVADYAATGNVEIGPPGKPAEFTLDIVGDDQHLVVNQLHLQQTDGSVDVAGSVTFQPALAWQLTARGESFDPGQLLAGWGGDLDFNIDTRGHDNHGLEAAFDIQQLSGTLRDRAVAAGGSLHLSPQQVIDGDLRLQAGKSKVAIHAAPGQRNDIRVDLDVVSASDWLPDAAGALSGHIRLRGKLGDLALQAELAGDTLQWQRYQVGHLALDADVPSLAAPGGRLSLDVADLQAGGFAFAKVDLDANGTEARHDLTLTASGPQLDLKVALHGELTKQAWLGQLTTLDLEPQGIPGWHLADSVPIKVADDGFTVKDLCLTAGDPELCLSAQQDARGAIKASYHIAQLPLQLLTALVPADALPVSAEGTLEGEGTIGRSAAGELSGHAELHSEAGSITLVENPERPLLGWETLRINADLDGGAKAVEIHGQLAANGHIDGRVTVTGPQQELAGQVDLDLDSLAFAELLSPAVANVHGALTAHAEFAGTLDSPQISGAAQLQNFRAEIPAAGLKLTQGQVQVSTGADGLVDLAGSVTSGEGELTLTGQLALGDEGSTRLVIRGENFTAADIPAAKVVVSPALAVQYAASGVDIAGRVNIEHAKINAERLPTGGAAHASPDVVIMDAPPKDAEDTLPVHVNVSVDFGDDTRLQGFGLDGRLKGLLTVEQKPGRAPIGRGQIDVSGTYTAYGQDLTIKRGQLVFASTPLANPGLNIRAVRSLDPTATIDNGQEVGLQISGTANRPVLTVFSNPPMPQSDALSYLITGKPLSSLKGGEGNLVGSAAQALGSATGDLLAKSIGNKLGIADIGVSSSTALGGAAAFTVGKYLSPRLYLNYGVGLFEPGTVITLRYLFSQHWNFEAIQATDYSRAALNYRYER